MVTDLVTVCRQAVEVHQIVQRINLEIWQRQERTKRACTNCIFFSGNNYLLCAVRPDGAGVSESEINDCLDWELINAKP